MPALSRAGAYAASEVINNKTYTDVRQPIALGGLTKGVTPYELNAAYASIANLGTYVDLVDSGHNGFPEVFGGIGILQVNIVVVACPDRTGIIGSKSGKPSTTTDCLPPLSVPSRYTAEWNAS